MHETFKELLSRQMKVRVWDPVQQKMLLMSLADLVTGKHNSMLQAVPGRIVHQYTHLKDKFDNDIYEGDLVRVYAAPEVYYTRLVLWRSDRAGWWIYKNNGLFDIAMTTELEHKVEVVGNIIEHPEKLK